MQGKLSDMTAIDLIQHNCMEQKTVRLTINNADQTAVVFFQGGNMTHASCGSLEGEEAIYQLISWEDGDFMLDAGITSPVNTITHNWSGILLEGARRLDEQNINVDDLNADQSIELGFEPMAIKIEGILKELGSEITGHIASTVVGMDAFTIASFSSEKVDIDSVSAQMTLLIKLVDTSVTKVDSTASMEDNLLTTQKAYLLMTFLPDKTHFLGVIADRKTAVLGNLRLMSNIYAERIAKVMPR
jgi:predicted regulator of Ras-like GTPase activity (Roadblock/LC7/MglB family)